MSKWWEKKDPKNYSEWQTLQTPEGLDYYYNTVTNETTWDKPDALKSEDELQNQGDWVWMPHEEQCFVPATVQSRYTYSSSSPKNHSTLTTCFIFSLLNAGTETKYLCEISKEGSTRCALMCGLLP